MPMSRAEGEKQDGAIMNTKYVTKRQLIALNKRAQIEGANHIDPAFLRTIPPRLKYPVARAMPIPMERGWVPAKRLPALTEVCEQAIAGQDSTFMVGIRAEVGHVVTSR